MDHRIKTSISSQTNYWKHFVDFIATLENNDLSNHRLSNLIKGPTCFNSANGSISNDTELSRGDTHIMSTLMGWGNILIY